MTVDQAAAAPAPVRGMVSDGVGVDADGNLVGVLLFCDDQGYMTELEVYAFGGTVDGRATEGRWGMPTVESFELAEWEPHEDGEGGTLINVPRRKTPGKN
jgi:hypothetical protein